ncbi:hypothetical protein BH18PSE1_BH18PSE1_12410 [soil metagenome]
MDIRTPIPAVSTGQIAKLLAHRYGDGTVYLPSGWPRLWLTASQAGGYVSSDGYVTRKGRELLARCEA